MIESAGVSPTIVQYLTAPPDADTLLRISALLDIPLSEFKDAGDAVPLDDNEALADWIAANPKVLERPIVVDEEQGRAVVGRPPENVLSLL